MSDQNKSMTQQALDMVREQKRQDEMKYRIIEWPCDDQIDADNLNYALAAVFNGKTCPIAVDVSNVAESCTYAIVVASDMMTQEAANTLYLEEMRKRDEELNEDAEESHRTNPTSHTDK